MLESSGAAHAWLLLRGARRLVADSRRVVPGDAFIAWPGHVGDGRRHVADALAAGAVASLVESSGVDAFGFGGEPRIAALRGLKAAAGEVASRFHGRPSEKLAVVAVTGTNGKTSIAWWVAQALGALGRRTAVIGTLGIGVPPRSANDGGPADAALADPGEGMVETGLTTPDPVALQAALADFVGRGDAACVIEASSIGIVEHRLAGTRVAVAVFSNFTQDHLDHHGTMTAYWQAKAQLFAWPGLQAAVINLDDARGVELAGALAGTAVETWTMSTRSAARLQAVDIRHGRDGLRFEVVEGDARARIATPLIGDYNVANLLAVIGVLRALGRGLTEATEACAALTPVPGRMQRVGARSAAAGAAGAPEVVVDYAHTPDALEKALTALRPLAVERGGRLWCVFGCGGNRDAGKRPLMGAIAVRLADRVVLTSDNPRLESADFILSQILAGAVGHDEVDVIENRAEAIRHAVITAAPNDVVLLAGKGHETYQDVGGEKLPFSDAAQATSALLGRAAGLRLHTDSKDKEAAAMLDLGSAAAAIAGACVVGDPGIRFARVHSDSRSLRAGDLFVALRGERFDGHRFLGQATAAGAVAALAESGLASAGIAGIEVADARLALGELAASWRRRFVLPLVAVAGSNGKTTVTQMIASIFRAWHGDAAFATEGNFNNDIGVPLTLLRLRRAHRAAVVELGMNHPGEIASLAAMARPTIALVNNAQREHLEFMTSVEAVARENGAVIEALGPEGIAIFPADDAHASTWQAFAGARRTLTFGEAAAAGQSANSGEGGAAGGNPDTHVTATARPLGAAWSLVVRTPQGTIEFELQAPGRHNVRNALAATAGAFAAGCPLEAIGRGLSAFRPVRGRSQSRRFVWQGSDRGLVDDTYNANPDSVRAAIDVLATLPAPRWLVLGDMGEVGDEGPAFHREVGAYAHERGIESLWAAGAESASTAAPFAGARAFADVEALLAALGEAPAAVSVLVKGSRFMRMERVVAALTGESAGDGHAA
ncbi:MAG: bifunctional UDP-N-acetylmuramoyl-L-alanyl-D-glutamate--2,6-diaminopimelate ligase MurE/UDP-N-acetylmuramoyl-tripeptide--D-alanyl-D-alanine ligase MurF [Pseudomonadota bacterium]|nr:bifunctional UDP-N-acetylmuramoyl-L-alanyl-D-glutamate--2,6-diaminopimelate ligase MurE/UDP-N-acetylmuramoyl-tripeptide--D-alanyl-D-alanine ligase MurF [Pseudomonadota bacterium]